MKKKVNSVDKREIISYLIVGLLTTVVCLGTYYLVTCTFLDPKNSLELQIANIISWVVAVIFAYFTNRKYVFKSKEKNILKEGSKFCLSRIITLLLDMLTMFIGVTLLSFNDRIAKLISQVVVTVGNYIISKFFVFKDGKKNKNNILSVFFKTILLLVSSVCVGALLLIIVYTIPTKRMFANAKESKDVFRSEGMYKEIISSYPNTRLDNFTDAIILNESIFDSKDDAIKKSMYVYRYNIQDPVFDLVNKLDGKEYAFHASEYGRYWHGNVVFTKLLLLLFSYSQIRLLNLFVQTLMLVYIFKLMKKNKLSKYVFDFAIPLMLIFPFIIAMSLQYSTVYYITLLSIILILKYNEKLDKKYIYFFMLIGAVTSYLDLLTFPILGLGMPLLFYLLMNKKNSTKDNIINIIKFSIFWAVGYFGMWFGKWIVGSILCNDNFFEIAFRAAKDRSSSDLGRLHAIKANIKPYFNKVYLLFIGLHVINHIIAIIKNKSKITLKKSYAYLLVMLLPFCWYFVMSQHSTIHVWFANKSVVLSIFAGFIVLNNIHDASKE